MPTHHAVLGPSSAHRWITCPGSVALSQEVPKQPTTAHAQEGTFAHTLGELEARRALLGESVSAETEHWETEVTAEYGADAPELMDEMREAADGYVDLLQGILEQHADESPMLMLERRVSPGVDGVWGTADAIVVTAQRVIVVDLKYGKGVPVSAFRNPQLSLYALGALADYGRLLGEPDTAEMVVYQPRIRNTSRWSVPVAGLEWWRDEIVLPAAREALAGSTLFHPSESACRWCPAAGICKPRAEAAAAQDFGMDPASKVLSNEDFADLLPRLPGISAWVKDVEAAALRRAYDEGEHIPGFKVVRSGGRRTIQDQDKALDLLAAAGVDKEAVTQVSLVTLAKLEKAVGGKDELGKVLGDVLAMSAGRESLVPESDKRAAVTKLSEAQADFQ